MQSSPIIKNIVKQHYSTWMNLVRHSYFSPSHSLFRRRGYYDAPPTDNNETPMLLLPFIHLCCIFATGRSITAVAHSAVRERYLGTVHTAPPCTTPAQSIYLSNYLSTWQRCRPPANVDDEWMNGSPMLWRGTRAFRYLAMHRVPPKFIWLTILIHCDRPLRPPPRVNGHILTICSRL